MPNIVCLCPIPMQYGKKGWCNIAPDDKDFQQM